MIRAALAMYYALCYSVGVASFIYALILRFTSRELFLGRFITCTAVMTVITASAAVSSVAGDALSPGLLRLLALVRLSAAAAFVYFVTAFAAEAFPFKAGGAVKRIAGAFAVLGLALCAADAVLGGDRRLEAAVLLIKNAAIAGSVLIILLPRSGTRPAANGPYGTFLRTASTIVAVLMPFILWEEIGGRFGFFPLRLNGTLTLPAFYGVWSASFLMARLRHGTAGRPARADAAFISRYGITPRESELLGLLVRGKSYKDIMNELSISMPTVKSHVASLYRKTGTANRLELASKVAAESGATAG